jgi:hypothetical protein
MTTGSSWEAAAESNSVLTQIPGKRLSPERRVLAIPSAAYYFPNATYLKLSSGSCFHLSLPNSVSTAREEYSSPISHPYPQRTGLLIRTHRHTIL